MSAGDRGDRRSPVKHQAILSAATDIFLEMGYARASVDAIASAAGVGKQTIYGHFGNKQRLFIDVVHFVRTTANGDYEAAVIADTGDPRADLQAAGEKLVRGILEPTHAALHRLTIAEIPHHPELMESWRDDGPSDDIVGAIGDYLLLRDVRGDLVVPDPGLSARQFVMLISAEAQVRSLRGIQTVSPEEIQLFVEAAVDLILRAHHPID